MLLDEGTKPLPRHREDSTRHPIPGDFILPPVIYHTGLITLTREVKLILVPISGWKYKFQDTIAGTPGTPGRPVRTPHRGKALG